MVDDEETKDQRRTRAEGKGQATMYMAAQAQIQLECPGEVTLLD